MDAFYDELEKIANALKPAKEYSLRAGQSAVRRLQQNAADLGKKLGKKRYLPFSEEHRAYSSAMNRARDADRRFKEVTRKRKSTMLREIQADPAKAPARGDYLGSAQQVLKGKKPLPDYLSRSQIKDRRRKLGLASGGTALVGGGALLATSSTQGNSNGGY